jgi:lysine-N-methylase
MATKLISPPGQRFACRDCPARCCRLPWRVRLEDDEARRYLADPWVRERAGHAGAEVIERGVLPMREVDRRLECVFLDGDGLCSLQKREGESYLPRTCQAFPFAFVRDEEGAVIAQLSQVCPSIRDNYGEPVTGRLATKLQQKGDVWRMSETMSTLGGVVLSRPQYVGVARRWAEALAGGGSPAAGLARIYDWTAAFEGALLDGPEVATDASVTAAMERADQDPGEPLPSRGSASFVARAVFASLLSGLCHPSRVRVGHRIGRTRRPWIEALRSFGNKLAWLLERGTVDMLFVPRPFPLQRVRAVERFLARDEGSMVAEFLRLVLQRRQIFCTEPRYLMEVVVDLALSATLVSRVARCRAAAELRPRVTPEDVREGISVAELLVISHAAVSEHGGLARGLRQRLIGDRAMFREVLATEA